MEVLTLKSGTYPNSLREIFDPPNTLYVEGHLAALQKPCVAIVGTRRCTPYGEAVAFALARELARAGVCVVSGLAFGIDAAAHRGALAGGGVTAAVVAQALDELGPVEHRSLAREIVEKGGAILSEKAAGQKSFKVDYLIRNRIVSGLSRAVVVVEAGVRSGALNTAKHAVEQGRALLAVPGRLTDEMSEGCFKLLGEGAHLLHRPEDVLGLLEMEAAARAPQALNGLEEGLLGMIREEPRLASELVELCTAAPQELYAALCQLEMKGMVALGENGRYALVSLA